MDRIGSTLADRIAGLVPSALGRASRPGPYDIPIRRQPQRHVDPAVIRLDAAISRERANFNLALKAAQHLRANHSNQAGYHRQVIAMKYGRVEIARLLAIRQILSSGTLETLE